MDYLMFQILKTSIYISLPIILIYLFRNKFLSKYTHKLNYIICILITIRMLFVVNIGICLPFEFLNKKNYGYIKSVYTSKLENSNMLNYMKIMFCIWIFGAIFVVLKSIFKHIIFYKKIQNINQIVTDNNIIKILEKEKEALNIRKNINVYEVEGLSSPALIGIIKNKIIIPNNVYDNKELKWIFRHELIHFKRKDNFLKLLLMSGSAIHWFNPLVKILRSYFESQCELSCDENVVKRFNLDEIKEYALLLLNTLRHRNTLKTTMFSSELNENGSYLVKGRVESMLSSKKRKKGTLIGVFLLFILGLSIFSFSGTSIIQVDENLVYANYTSSGENDEKEEQTKDTSDLNEGDNVSITVSTNES